MSMVDILNTVGTLQKGILAILPFIYTSYEANFPLHISHEIAHRFCVTSGINWTLVTNTEDCTGVEALTIFCMVRDE